MKNILFLIFTCVILSCSESPETKFDKNGVSLICPQGWTCDFEKISEDVSYLEIEKEGWDSSGLFIISWYNNNNLSHKELLNSYKESFLEQSILEFSGISFSNYYENTFNKISTISTNYTMNLLGIDHKGIIHVFRIRDKDFVIISQEAIEDVSKNKKGFEMITNSIKME